MSAVRFYAIHMESGIYLLLTQNLTVLRRVYITNPTAEDWQAVASREYPNISPADWYVNFDDGKQRFEIVYLPY